MGYDNMFLKMSDLYTKHIQVELKFYIASHLRVAKQHKIYRSSQSQTQVLQSI